MRSPGPVEAEPGHTSIVADEGTHVVGEPPLEGGGVEQPRPSFLFTGAIDREAAVRRPQGHGARRVPGWIQGPSPARTWPSQRRPLPRRADLGWQAGTAALAPRSSARNLRGR